MPTQIYHRLWCASCKEWTLGAKGLFSSQPLTCKECNAEFAETPYSDIPEAKIMEQRARYRESQINSFGSILTRSMLGLTDENPFKQDWDKPEIVEHDAGQKAIDDAEAKKREEEYQQRKAAEAKLAEEYFKFAHLGRNDDCACGSGKKYKKCCMYKYENL